MSKDVKKKPSTAKHLSQKKGKEEQDVKAQATALLEKSQLLISRYLLLFAVGISSLTVIGALLIAQHYIDPVRDETIYTQGESQITLVEIDQEKLQTLENSLENTPVEVGTDFVPNRNNPFAE